MEILLADKAGFCFGVKRAINTAFKAATAGTVYCLGPLIHNPQEVGRLSNAGVIMIDDLAKLRSGDRLIIRSHGVPPKVLEEARQKGISIIDLTCPFVSKAQRHAEALKNEGYQVVVIGENNHPEVQSILGYAGERAVAIMSRTDLKDMRLNARIGVVAQTTQSYSNFSEIVLDLLSISRELKVYNTICNSTTERQNAAEALALTVDVMVVVGGRNSANTSRLVSVCKRQSKPTYHIEMADELQQDWIADAEKIGVTAGASTPDWIVEGVIKRLRESTDPIRR